VGGGTGARDIFVFVTYVTFVSYRLCATYHVGVINGVSVKFVEFVA